MKNSYQAYYQKSISHPEEFWAEQAEAISWFKPYKQVLDRTSSPINRWFLGGELNVCYNAVDRHVENGGDRVAIYYHSEMTQTQKSITYAELQKEVARLAGLISDYGVTAGDRVVIYMPMIPEAIYAMLACARIGAIHSVVFGGFSAKVLSERIDDCEPKMILAASCGLEPNKVIDYKTIIDESLARCQHQVEKTLIFQRPKQPASLKAGIDFDWEEALANYKGEGVPCVPMKSEDFLYILYTSGTTGNPKGVVRDNAGYLVALYWSMKYLYGMKAGDVYWAMSDIGWVVGHSYIVYAPLIYGCSTVLYEGKPVGTPDAGVVWKIISKYKVKALFTAPTAIRAIVREDNDAKFIKKYNLSSLKALFLAGERTDSATLRWAQQQLGVPVVDHWWQTETGWAICGNPLGYFDLHGEPYLPIKEGSCTVPMPGWDVEILDEGGKSVSNNEMGAIAIKLPLPPSTMPTIWNQSGNKGDDAFRDNYLTEYPGYYKTGDTGVLNDGYLTVLSRNDDVINIAGHRISTGEVEEVIAFHPVVAECAVVGTRDELKGEVPVAFVVLIKGGQPLNDENIETINNQIKNQVRKEIGAIVVLKTVYIIDKLPKTRSGKILRATIRKIINHEPFNLPPTIEDPNSLDVFKKIFNYPKNI